MDFFNFVIFFIAKFALVGSTLFLVMVNRTILSVFILISAFIIASVISILSGVVLPPSFYLSASGFTWSLIFFSAPFFTFRSFYKYKDLVLLVFVLGFLAFMPPFFFLGEKFFLIKIFFQIFVPSPRHLDRKVLGVFLVLIGVLFLVPLFFLFQHTLIFSPLSTAHADEGEVGFPVRSPQGEVGFPVQYREWKTIERFPIYGSSAFFEQPVAWKAYYPLFTITQYINMGTGVSSGADDFVIVPSFPASLAGKPVPSGKEAEDVELADSSLYDYPASTISPGELDNLTEIFESQVRSLAVHIKSSDYNLFKGSYPADLQTPSHFPASLTERQVMAFRYKSRDLSGIDWKVLIFEVSRVVPVLCENGIPLDSYNNNILLGLFDKSIPTEEFISILRMNPVFDAYVARHLTYSLCRAYVASHPSFGGSFWSISDLRDDYFPAISEYVSKSYHEPMSAAQVDPTFDRFVDRALAASRVVNIQTYNQIPHMSGESMSFGDPHYRLSEFERVVLGVRAASPNRLVSDDPIFWVYYMDLLRESLKPVDFPDVLGPKRFGDHLEFFRSFFQSEVSSEDFLVYIRKNHDVDELFSQILILELCFIKTY